MTREIPMDVLAADPTAAMTDIVVALNGHVDESEVQRACQRLTGAAPRPAFVRVDFARAHSIDVGALEPLVRLTSELARHGVPVDITPAWAEDVVRLTGLDSRFPRSSGPKGRWPAAFRRF